MPARRTPRRPAAKAPTDGRPGGGTPGADAAEPADPIEPIVSRLLAAIGEDPARAGLARTPHRVAKAYRFMTQGYAQDPAELLNGAVFREDTDEMVVVRDIEVYSLCEHHLVPFFGKAHVGYLPKGRIVGLSKIPRIVDAYARRLQVQERLTSQIARALDQVLAPRGVGVVIEAQHLCMMMRGVEKQNSRAVTSCMLGLFRSDARTRAEFLEFLR
ncbi:MAG: GTP cyclohydrolase 1 [Planctomycetes bacterium]|nr:GTP cyclohydrolase 1 [Planctomycetota bacterium]